MCVAQGEIILIFKKSQIGKRGGYINVDRTWVQEFIEENNITAQQILRNN